MTNTEWASAYATFDAGQPFQTWCCSIHASEPELAAALLEGAQHALNDGERFLQKYGDGDRFLVTITPCPLGALVLHQELSPAPERMRAQKMETVGRLVAGVAHDFANVITMIDGYSDILLNRVPPTDPLRAELEEVRKATSHGAHLTAQLLSFTRGQDVHPVVLDLNLLIGEMQRMLRPIIGENIRLQADSAANLARVVADPGQMEQVFVNLILNARDAMPDGGVIRIQTANTGSRVTFSVTDTGCGMDVETASRVFEPFFTTKERGKGNGLGLSTVRDIVRQNGGEIRVRSAPGEGSTFTISLPCAHQPISCRDAAPAPARAGCETVLLVEDEDGVRHLLTRLLRRNGYEVIEAASGSEALRIFDERAQDIHLVLTDMVMPGMSGRALADRLWELRPELRILFMSGYPDDVLSRTGALSSGARFLQKPLRPDVLSAKVREALDSPVLPFNPR